MKVLIVEDERITRDQLEFLLNEWGYQVIAAEDGSEAWEIAKNQKIRLIITDLLMPGVDGIELIKRVRGMKTDYYTYILIVTGMSDQKSLYDAMFVGGDDFIVKPWHNAEVRARLRTGERIIHLEDELKERIKKLEEANMVIKSANERMMREVAFMSRMQSTMLPSDNSDFFALDFAWKHQPHSIMAGDGMNIFRLDEQNYAVVFVDVSESGDAASYLLSSLARKFVPIPGQPGILKLLSRTAPGYEIVPPARVLKQICQEFPLDIESGHHFSVFYGIINIETESLCFSAAGGPTPFILNRNGKISNLPVCSKPIGRHKNSFPAQHSVDLSKCARILFYSGGLSSMCDSSEEPFGNKRLKELVKKSYNLDIESFVEKIFSTALAWGDINEICRDISVMAVDLKE